MKRLLNKNKKIATTGLILLALLFILPLPANALFGIDPVSIAGSVFSFFSYVISYIFGLFFMLGGWLVGVTMDMNMNILGTDNTLVSVGWSILRDIANLGFVLIMIIIAVTTIVRYESSKYGTKMLPILIGAAILVNFSLTIAGVFINFSNTVSNIFLVNSFGNGSETTFNPVDFGKIVGGAFNPQRMLLKDEGNPAPPDPASQAGGLSTFSTATLMFIAGLVFNIVFMAIATFSLFILALMLLYRYIYLSIILVLAPLAYLFWAFPDLKGHWSDWWNNFIKWTFFLPAVTFFSYLAVKAAETLGKKPMVAGAGFDGSIETIMSNGVQMVLLAGLMLGGIIVAQQMGIKGAEGAMKLATSAKDSILGATGKFARTKTTNFGRRMLTAGVNAKGETALERWGASKAGKIPLIGAAITGMSGLSSKAKANANKDLEEAQKKIDSRTGNDAVSVLNRQVTGGAMMSDTDLAAWGIKAAKEGKWGELDNDILGRILDAVKRTNSKDKILGFIPHLADKLGTDTEKAMTKYVQDASKLSKDILGENNISINLKSSHITQLANIGTKEQKDAVTDTLKTTIGPTLGLIDQALIDIGLAKSSGNAANLQAAQAALNNIVSHLNPDGQKAFGVYKNIQSNVNW